MNSLSFHIYQENISISSPPKIETISMIQCILEMTEQLVHTMKFYVI